MLERERHRQVARTRTERKAARHPEVRDALTNKRALGALDAARPALLQQVTKELDRQVKARDNARPVSALGFNLPFSKGAGQAVISTARKVGATIGGQGIQALLHTNSDFLQKRGEAAGTDVVDLVTNAVPSTYALGREIVKGHERKALNMILDPYKQLAEHPVKSFSEHPVLSSLLLSGTYGGVGRTAGGILRHSPSETLRAIGTTHAPARTKVIPGTGVNILGTYSPNVITKAGQVARDRRRGAPDIIPKGNEQARYANSFIGREEDIRRVDRNIADRQSHNDIRLKDEGPVLGGRRNRNKPSAATSLVAQGIAHPRELRASLEEYRAQVQASHDRAPDGRRKRQQKETLRHIDQSLKRLDEPAQVAAAQRFAQTNLTLHREMQKRRLAPADDIARYVPYAVQHMGARRITRADVEAEVKALRDKRRGRNADKAHIDAEIQRVKATEGQVVNEAGQRLTREDIAADMQQRGFLDPAMVSQAPGFRGAKNFYAAMKEPRGVGNEMRTGKATLEGSFDVHPGALVEQNVKSQGLIDAHDSFKRFIHHFGYHQGDKLKAGSYKDMKALADKLHDKDPRVEWQPVRALPLAARRDLVDSVLSSPDHIEGHAHVKEALDQALSEAPGDTRGAFVLVPARIAQEYRGHLQRTVHPVISAISSAFRGTVLGTNLNWLTGNVVEAGCAHSSPGRGSGHGTWDAVR
jgi:hypothetical protein